MKCVCDRCGIKFDHYYVTGSNYALSFPEVRVLAQGDGDSHCVVENIFDLYQDWGINLCPDCSEKFMDWMHSNRNDADILLQDAKNDLRIAEERIENLEADVNRLHSDIFELSKENDKLEDDNEQLNFMNNNLIKDVEALEKENHCIMKDSEWRVNRIDELEKENHCLRNEIDQLNSELNGGGINGSREVKSNMVETPKIKTVIIDSTNCPDRLNCHLRGSNSNCQYPKRKGKTRNKRSH